MSELDTRTVRKSSRRSATRAKVTYDEDVVEEPKKPRKRKAPQNKPKDPREWSTKEKQLLLDGLKHVPDLRIPDDLPTVQKYVPHRSVAEITEYIDTLLRKPTEKAKADAQTYKETNMKKWIGCCDSLSGVAATCSETGDGNVIASHPALSWMNIVKDLETDIPLTSMDKAVDQNVNWNLINSFLARLLKGESGYTGEWSFRHRMEAALLFELYQDVTQQVQDSEYPVQLEHFFNKYRESSLPVEAELVENPFPTAMYDSRFLNPLGLTETLTQCVKKKPFSLYRTAAALDQDSGGSNQALQQQRAKSSKQQ